MKKSLGYFTIRILHENATYLVILCVLVLAFIFSLVFFTATYEKGNEKISTTERDISKLKNETKFITYKNEIVSQGINVDEMNKSLSALVPETEDFFSIVATLEKLSASTNFIITSYSLNLKESTKDKLSITINGQGNADTFLAFLKEYNFGGGRLMTVDTIRFSSRTFSGVELQANFYNQKTKAQVEAALQPLSAADKQLIKQIYDKISMNVKQEEVDSQDYSVKSNPF